MSLIHRIILASGIAFFTLGVGITLLAFSLTTTLVNPYIALFIFLGSFALIATVLVAFNNKTNPDVEKALQNVVNNKTIQVAPNDLIKKYAGQWVALRSGKVIASAESRKDLRDKSGVSRQDTIYQVPSSSISV